MCWGMGEGEVCQICFSKIVLLHRLKKFEVRNAMNGNSFIIRNDLKGIAFFYYYHSF